MKYNRLQCKHILIKNIMGLSLGFPKTENKENSVPLPSPGPFPKLFFLNGFKRHLSYNKYKYIYIYIYVCVCVCFTCNERKIS